MHRDTIQDNWLVLYRDGILGHQLVNTTPVFLLHAIHSPFYTGGFHLLHRKTRQRTYSTLVLWARKLRSFHNSWRLIQERHCNNFFFRFPFCSCFKSVTTKKGMFAIVLLSIAQEPFPLSFNNNKIIHFRTYSMLLWLTRDVTFYLVIFSYQI